MHDYWPSVKQLEARLREAGIEGGVRARTIPPDGPGETPPVREARLRHSIAGVLARREPFAAPRLALDEVAVRRATPDDRGAFVRLATLDERSVGDGAYLVAEVDGELTAAVSIDDVAERPITHPFRPSAAVGEHLRQLLASSTLSWRTSVPTDG
jgi:hypothetical protein